MMRSRTLRLTIEILWILSVAVVCASSQTGTDVLNRGRRLPQVWSPDDGPGRFRNPIIFADYSDPDVIRADSVYYLTASSFQCVPGLPVLESRDLVHWEILGYALPRLIPEEKYRTPQHGMGVWAPAIRQHLGKWYIYYSDPDSGIFVVTAAKPAGPWSPPKCVRAAKGWIDPCPFWDDNGNAWLVHAFARSRTGFNSILRLHRMSPAGDTLFDDGIDVFDGHSAHPTIEGPKLYKRNKWYYIFAPAGGVREGWQTVLRSRSITGPYQDRIVLRQGTTAINGPHQGAWVESSSGASWFIHFRDAGAYGRITYLEPMVWNNDWPVIGDDPDRTGIGTPVTGGEIPERLPVADKPPASWTDEFPGGTVGPQWQWQSNPDPSWIIPDSGASRLRLACSPDTAGHRNLWNTGRLLLQKFPADCFESRVQLTLGLKHDGDMTGLIVFGRDYSGLVIRQEAGERMLYRITRQNADKDGPQVRTDPIRIDGQEISLCLSIDSTARCRFFYGTAAEPDVEVGEPFSAVPGVWVGARFGVFSLGIDPGRDCGWVDVRRVTVGCPRHTND